MLGPYCLFQLVLTAVVMMIGLEITEGPAIADDGMVKRAKRMYVLRGSNARPHEFPWTVFTYTKFNGGREADCTGTLISPRVVLTAAHCVKFRNESGSNHFDAHTVAIYPGWHKNPKREIISKGLNIFSVAPISSSEFDSPPLPKPHKNYSYYDYSVFILKEPLKLNKTIGFIPMADSKSPPARRLICYAAGYGTTGRPDPTIANKLFKAFEFVKLQRYRQTFWSRVLQKIRFIIQPEKRCYQIDKATRMKHPNATEKLVDGVMKELKELDGSAPCGLPVPELGGICHGDSGSPLMCRKRRGPWVLYGVVSGGYGSCEGLTFFASVPKISGWLKQIVNKHDPGFLPSTS